LAHHCLLGTDFLRKHNAKIDFQKMTIIVDRSECEINYSSQSTTVCRASLKQTICIPPGDEMLVEGKVSKKERGLRRAGTFVVEQRRSLKIMMNSVQHMV
jgi:hypothetical protein